MNLLQSTIIINENSAWSAEKDKESKNSEVSKTSKGKIIPLPKCAMCDNKKLIFIKTQKGGGLLSKLWI